jgi:uncharacterized membrane-anchored protein YhcB (DUF1043 family)
MHDAAPLIASTSVIIIGMIAGILFNQRAIDRLESRMESRMDRMESRLDRLQTDMVEFFKILSRHDEAIDTLKKRP